MLTFNDIPPIEKDYDFHSRLFTAVLTNNGRSWIRVTDYEAILCLSKGVHSIQEADAKEQRYVLIIEESPLNQAAYHAVDNLYEVIKNVSHWLTSKGIALRRCDTILRSIKIPGTRRPDIELIEELRVTGKLTRYRATLGNTLLAIAYKLDGRKITLDDALATLARDNQMIQSMVDYYQGRLQYYSTAFAVDVMPELLTRSTMRPRRYRRLMASASPFPATPQFLMSR
jgi:hypothetical protein